MERLAKEQFVEDFRESLSASSVLYLADFSGLNVKSMTKLRRSLRESGAQFMVVKNRLAKRALAELDLPEISDHLVGPTGFILAEGDAAAPAQVVKQFAKEHNDRPVFKVGVLDAALLSPQDIQRIADLPPREQLLAEVAGAFQAPMAALASALGALTQELAGLMDALKEQKS